MGNTFSDRNVQKKIASRHERFMAIKKIKIAQLLIAAKSISEYSVFFVGAKC